jgi:branched-chain amino acid transport system substrate-binding protein
MSDFDPTNPVVPTGDTIKLGLLEIFSGSGAGIGQMFWMVGNWVAHDLNKRGGILVDGKRKKIQILKGDVQGKAATTKKEAEKMILEEKVHARALRDFDEPSLLGYPAGS